LGRVGLDNLILHERCPPLPFHHRQSGWRYAWLA
jgi:hypothetical protein